MLKATLLIVLIALWGLAECKNIAEAEEDDDAANSGISKDVNNLKYLFVNPSNDVVEVDFNNKHSLEVAEIRRNLPVVVTIDGFLSNSTSPLTSILREAFRNHGGYNLFILDWSRLSGSNARVDNSLRMAGAYLTVLGNVGSIGNRLAEFLELLESEKGIPLSDVTLVGGSLGAHIAGAAGTWLRRRHGVSNIGRTVGLDPAGPFFSMQVDRDKRLHKGDARFVEIYHSNRGTLGDADHDTGDINIYINGGDKQPGCAEIDKSNSGLCSHNYAFKLFAHTFNNDVVACSCTGDSACTCNGCSYTCASPISIGLGCPQSASGRYHVSTSHVFA